MSGAVRIVGRLCHKLRLESIVPSCKGTTHGRWITVPGSIRVRCELGRTFGVHMCHTFLSACVRRLRSRVDEELEAVLGARFLRWLLCAPSCAALPDESALTIYSSQQPGAIAADFYRPVPGGALPAAASVPGYALVRQDRDVQVASGRSSLRFTDVAGLIDPTTVTFSVPANSGVRVIEQNFQFDLVSTPKLLLRYLDRPITVERNVGNQTSTRHRHAAVGRRRSGAARERWQRVRAAMAIRR